MLPESPERTRWAAAADLPANCIYFFFFFLRLTFASTEDAAPVFEEILFVPWLVWLTGIRLRDAGKLLGLATGTFGGLPGLPSLEFGGRPLPLTGRVVSCFASTTLAGETLLEEGTSGASITRGLSSSSVDISAEEATEDWVSASKTTSCSLPVILNLLPASLDFVVLCLLIPWVILTGDDFVRVTDDVLLFLSEVSEAFVSKDESSCSSLAVKAEAAIFLAASEAAPLILRFGSDEVNDEGDGVIVVVFTADIDDGVGVETDWTPLLPVDVLVFLMQSLSLLTASSSSSCLSIILLSSSKMLISVCILSISSEGLESRKGL